MTFAPWLLWSAVVAAVGAVVVPAPGAARRLLGSAAVALTGSTALLGAAFVSGDWRFAYVADNARTGVGPLLRLAGVWAGPEGSLLLWTTLTAWVAVLSARATPPVARPAAVRVGAALTAAYALVSATAAWPFERLAVPAVDGVGLVPVLEHPAMVWHPPLLYTGLVGMLAPLIVAAAGALAGRGPGVAARVLAMPLALLTVGLTTGSLWAVVELGWGGFWAWDPIETAGLVAWLCGAAALHATVRSPGPVGSAASASITPGPRPTAGATVADDDATVVRDTGATVADDDATVVRDTGATVAAKGGARRNDANGATVASGGGGVVVGGRPGLAVVVAPGVAALWATTLTRIGVISSVHAFAERPGLRGALITVASLASLAVVALVLLVPPPAPDGGTSAGPWVRDRRAAVGALLAAATLVALGTYEPLVEAATTGDVLAVAGTYYTRLLWPLCLVAALLALRADRSLVAAGIGAGVGLALVPWAAGPFALLLGATGGAVAGAAIGAGSAARPAPQRSGGHGADRADSGPDDHPTEPTPGGPHDHPTEPTPGGPHGHPTEPTPGGPHDHPTEPTPGGPHGHPTEPTRGGRRGRRLGGTVAHAGVGVLLVGVAGTVAGSSGIVTVVADREVPVAGHTLVHRSIELTDDGSRPAALATVELDGVTLHPGLVSHTARAMSSVELARRFDGLDEAQVILIDGDDDHARYQVNDLPRLGLVWLGAAAVTIGAGLTAGAGRRRIPTGPIAAERVQR